MDFYIAKHRNDLFKFMPCQRLIVEIDVLFIIINNLNYRKRVLI